MKRELTDITVTFSREGIEYGVSYAHQSEPPTPGTKKRTVAAATMARKGLEAALEGLSKEALWGGFGTDTKVTTDTVVVERMQSSGRRSG